MREAGRIPEKGITVVISEVVTLREAQSLIRNLHEAGYRNFELKKWVTGYCIVVNGHEVDNYDAAVRIVQGLLVQKEVMTYDKSTKMVKLSEKEKDRIVSRSGVENNLRDLKDALGWNKIEGLSKEHLDDINAVLKNSLKELSELQRKHIH